MNKDEIISEIKGYLYQLTDIRIAFNEYNSIEEG